MVQIIFNTCFTEIVPNIQWQFTVRDDTLSNKGSLFCVEIDQIIMIDKIMAMDGFLIIFLRTPYKDNKRNHKANNIGYVKDIPATRKLHCFINLFKRSSNYEGKERQKA